MSLTLLLMRHPPVAVPKGLCYGRTDVELIADYVQHLAQPKACLRRDHKLPTHIFSSPAQRCRLAAEQLTWGHICVDERLQELDFGLWEGRLWSEIKPEESQSWCDDIVNERPPQGESFLELASRAQDFLESTMVGIPSDSTVLVVTHAGVMRALHCVIRKFPLQEAFQLPLDYGQILSFTL